MFFKNSQKLVRYLGYSWKTIFRPVFSKIAQSGNTVTNMQSEKDYSLKFLALVAGTNLDILPPNDPMAPKVIELVQVAHGS